MKASTVNELKEELRHRSVKELIELCTRLARFKKENKELLTFLLFEAGDEPGYIAQVKLEIDFQFGEIEKNNSTYLVKKSVRKILRMVNKYIRYTGSKAAEIELVLHYCKALKMSGIRMENSTALTKLYQQQVLKAEKLLSAFHEDLQYDYRKQLELLQ